MIKVGCADDHILCKSTVICKFSCKIADYTLRIAVVLQESPSGQSLAEYRVIFDFPEFSS